MNEKNSFSVVTGAFGYLGRYITGRLLDDGQVVKTITNSTSRYNPFGERVEAFPYNFDNSDELVKTLQGAEVLYITYWVRFNHATFTHAMAVANTLKLFDAAKKAGVKRVVYVSITNPSIDSDLEYFSGKGKLEKALIESGLSYAILRPAVLFGGEDILVNNIAWGIRRFPVVGMFGDGSYRLQPIHVDDMAKLAVAEGLTTENKIIDAIGPETFTYRELIETIGKIIGVKKPIVAMPPMVAYYSLKLIGYLTKDVVVTKEEIKGLMDNLLYVDSPPRGQTKLTQWAEDNKESLGKRYASELARRHNRSKAYDKL